LSLRCCSNISTTIHRPTKIASRGGGADREDCGAHPRVQPNCTNQNDSDCSSGRYFESDTDGLNGINSRFTVTSDTDMGPTWYCVTNGECEPPVWVSWCKYLAVACGDGTSAGLLK